MDEPLRELLRLQSKTKKRLSPRLGGSRKEPEKPAPLAASELRDLASLAELSEEQQEARIERLEMQMSEVYAHIERLSK